MNVNIYLSTFNFVLLFTNNRIEMVCSINNKNNLANGPKLLPLSVSTEVARGAGLYTAESMAVSQWSEAVARVQQPGRGKHHVVTHL